MEKKRVAIQGIKASFHEEAALKFFGEDIETIECSSFKKTCEVLKNKEADFVVMAIENSIAGSLLPNYSLLRDYHFSIIGEVYLHIQLNLLALPGVRFEQIKRVESHPIAIRQCDDFFSEFPHLNVVESSDTAACAKKIRDEQLTDTAAIANKLAAKLYGLDIMERRIESNKKNYTRFLILTDNKDIHITNANKASLSFQVTDDVGSLAKVLNVFAEHGINLSKIQSMPVLGKRNQYNFYVDIEWGSKEKYEQAIRQVLRHTVNFTIMGEYLKNETV
ncbi:prephenate dehydratase [Pedobacter sp. SYSU D00535]|uniref:prephenate dehydratase n=1 Tax=Pedobacter sp. SYSU D00535 TaxID=2810308 RepID=UPI001A978FCC|nr:prephenate dehydratase [Pedobacter sp. SYSU D00535]